MQLGPIQRLQDPIPTNKWKRISFIYTTGERLLSAKSIQYLGVHDEERQILWRSLKERAEIDNQYGVKDLPEIAVDPQILAMLGFGLFAERDDKEYK
jgi:hypothetical protein